MKQEDGLPVSRGRLKEPRRKKKRDRRMVVTRVGMKRTTVTIMIASPVYPESQKLKNQPSFQPRPKP